MMSWFPEEFSLVAPRAELDPTDALAPRFLVDEDADADEDADDRDEQSDPPSEAVQIDTRGLHWTRALLEACQRLRPAED